MILVGVTEGREDFPAHPEIGMVHVSAFGCLRHAQRDAAKLGGGHGFFSLLTTLLAFPLNVYQNFFREHTYQLATQNFPDWFLEQIKGLGLELIFTPLALIALYGVFRVAPKMWWIWGTIVTVFLFMIGAVISPVFIEPVFNKYKPLGRSCD